MSESSNRSRAPTLAGLEDGIFAGILHAVDHLSVRVLCVDDDAYQLQVLRELFQRANATQSNLLFAAHTCSSSAEALDELGEANGREQPYHLILFDMSLAESTSLSVLTQVRALVGHSVPIIMVSAQAQQSLVSGCIAAGADSFLAKPLSAFALFGFAQRNLLKKQKPGATVKEIVKAIGDSRP